ncbi:MAG: class I SAM-dependent methyltransferase [Gaiellaceae bacterium]
MIRLNDPELVRRQYETEAGLAVRRDAWARFHEGPDAFEAAVRAVVEFEPQRVLEVGCGMGQFAARLAEELDAEVVATDLSPRMVELARARGVDARVADVQELPFDDGEFDCATANWMLYHVPDLQLALRELARVLGTGGCLVASTVGADHMAEAWDLVGFRRPQRPFSRENGEALLRRCFRRVERRDIDAALVFPDAPSVHRYLESTIFGEFVHGDIPEFQGPFRSGTKATVFVAER